MVMLIWGEFCQTIFTQHTLKILCERSVQGPAALPFGENDMIIAEGVCAPGWVGVGGI